MKYISYHATLKWSSISFSKKEADKSFNPVKKRIKAFCDAFGVENLTIDYGISPAEAEAFSTNYIYSLSIVVNIPPSLLLDFTNALRLISDMTQCTLNDEDYRVCESREY